MCICLISAVALEWFEGELRRVCQPGNGQFFLVKSGGFVI